MAKEDKIEKGEKEVARVEEGSRVGGRGPEGSFSPLNLHGSQSRELCHEVVYICLHVLWTWTCKRKNVIGRVKVKVLRSL